MSDDATILAGKDAWARLRHDRRGFDDWVLVGRLLIAARSLCMKRANCNSPYGPGYQRYIREWLEANGLQDIDSHERRGAIVIVETLVEIEAWRSKLSAVEQRRCNHPNSVLAHFRRNSRPTRSGPKTQTDRPKSGNFVAGRYLRPIKFDQQMIKRAGDAMRQSWSNDCYRLAAIALSAAIRNEIDLLELLPSPPPPKPPSATAVALELA